MHAGRRGALWTILEEEVINHVHEKMDLNAFYPRNPILLIMDNREVLDNASEIGKVLHDVKARKRI